MVLGAGMVVGDCLEVDHCFVWAVPDEPNQGGELGTGLVHVSVGEIPVPPRRRFGAVRHPRGHLRGEHCAQFGQRCGPGFVVGTLGIE